MNHLDDNGMFQKADWQCKSRGSNEDEYEIYVANAEALGWKVKSFEEWLES